MPHPVWKRKETGSSHRPCPWGKVDQSYQMIQEPPYKDVNRWLECLWSRYLLLECLSFIVSLKKILSQQIQTGVTLMTVHYVKVMCLVRCWCSSTLSTVSQSQNYICQLPSTFLTKKYWKLSKPWALAEDMVCPVLLFFFICDDNQTTRL